MKTSAVAELHQHTTQATPLAMLAEGVNRAESEYRESAHSRNRPAPALEFRSLAELAAFLRGNLHSTRRFVVRLDSSSYVLDLGQRVYASQMAGSDLKAFQNRPGLTIRMAERRSPIDATQGASRRLDDFLWHLGLHAGSGSLLPWLAGREVFRMKRWPPLFSNDSRSQAFRVAALLCRGAKKPAEIAKATGMPSPALADFLNACSLVDCLEERGSARADADGGPAEETASGIPAPTGPSKASRPSRAQGWLLTALELVFLAAGIAALYYVLTPQPRGEQTAPTLEPQSFRTEAPPSPFSISTRTMEIKPPATVASVAGKLEQAAAGLPAAALVQNERDVEDNPLARPAP